MTTAASDISIPVDLTNPGQFFACCGLLELADRLWPEKEVCARFDERKFHLSANQPSEFSFFTILNAFSEVRCDQLDPTDNAASRLYLPEPFTLKLDWWCKRESRKNEFVDLGGGEKLKPWAGKQSGPVIFRLMKDAVRNASEEQSPLDYPAAVSDTKDGKKNKKTISPFYFDARREGTSLDLGFSPDEQGMSVQAYPVAEALALVGLQRFRPFTDDSTHPKSFLYTAWASALPAAIAALAVPSVLSTRAIGCFRFTKPSRGGEYMTMFSRAQRERSDNEWI